MEYAPSFGAWVRQLRLRLGLTQAEVGQATGYAGETIRKIEADARRPSPELAERLADCLKIAVEERGAFLRFARGESAAIQPAPLSPQTVPLPTRTAEPSYSPLLVPPTPLIAREREVAAVSELLCRPEARLVTLTGPGGIGKTRLALQVAAELDDMFAHGVVSVALASITDPALVLPTIMRSLGFTELGGRPLQEQFIQYLRDKQLLLVLDNFEHLRAAAPLISEVLAEAPYLTVLVTSRVVLHLSGEHEFPVPPLALPDPTRLPPFEALAHTAAVALFVARARAVRPDFHLTPATAPAVVEICARLDGLPLAIELAAARSKVLSPPALVARLRQRLSLLTGGARDLAARHQTLRATLDWSYQLLEAEEQLLFARLAVFVGGWTLEAAEAVCQAGGELPLMVLDGLQALVDNSLVQRVDGTDHEPRFRMLETVREYALEHVQARGEGEALQHQHALYYLALAERVEMTMDGSSQKAWFELLEQDHDNLRAALQWACTIGAAEIGVRLSAALWKFWQLHGHLREGYRWLQATLNLAGAVPASARAKALNGTALLCLLAEGDRQQTMRWAEASLLLYRELGDKRGVARALVHLGSAQSSLHLLRLGQVRVDQHDLAHALACFSESLQLAREIGRTESIARALVGLGAVHGNRGELAPAQRYLEESVALHRGVGDTNGTAWAMQYLAWVVQQQHDYALAQRYLEESLSFFRENGDLWNAGISLKRLGDVARMQGDYQRAAGVLQESLALFHDLGGPGDIIMVTDGLAMLAVVQGHASRAARLWGAAEALQAASGVPVPLINQSEHEQAVTRARMQLGETTWTAAWAEGRAMQLEQATAYASETATICAETAPPPLQTRTPTVTSRRAMKHHVGGLTERERAVVILIAQGKSNQEIADTLVVSKRTIETHIGNIMAKVGVTTRVQIVVWAINTGLLNDAA